jgi:hypothetical protein
VSVRRIKAIYTASDDPNFGDPVQAEVVLIAPEMIMEVEGDEWTFLLIPKVDDDQDTIEVDRAKCWYFALGLMHAYDTDLEVDYDYLANCSFLDFIRKFGKK